VLRLGANAGTFLRAETNVEKIVSAMTGGVTVVDA